MAFNMDFIYGLCIGSLVGGFLGLLIFALCSAAKGDRYEQGNQ